MLSGEIRGKVDWTRYSIFSSGISFGRRHECHLPLIVKLPKLLNTNSFIVFFVSVLPTPCIAHNEKQLF